MRDAGRTREFLADVVHGLSRRPRSLPCKYFYDRTGSLLFERICELPEYYLTRSETALISAHADELAAAIGPRGTLIELGSGSSHKTRLLLDRLPQLDRYVPLDISAEHLGLAAAALRERYPTLDVQPVVADFTRDAIDAALPALGWQPPPAARASTSVFFPGSSIGNFDDAGAVALLSRMKALAGPGGLVLVGVDPGIDPAATLAAYDDAAGVTAAFNLNLLARIDRELGGDFDLSQFRHEVAWLQSERCIEMRLSSSRSQEVRIDGRRFGFEAGEIIVTERCYKRSQEALRQLGERSGLSPARVWAEPMHGMFMLELRA